jgi:hypothetical protein
MSSDNLNQSAPFAIDIDFSEMDLGYVFEQPIQRLAPLNKISLFVGPNNSGKSRLMRSILNLVQKKKYAPFTDLTLAFWNDYPAALAIAGEEVAVSSNDSDYRRIGKLLNNLKLTTFETNARNDCTQLDNLISRLPDNKSGTELKSRKQNLVAPFSIAPLAPFGLQLVYIPTMRGFRTPEGEPTYSSNRVRKEYFDGLPQERIGIHCGGDMYGRLKNRLLGNKSERKSISEFEKFLAENFFDGLAVTLIPHESEKQIYITIGREKERMISNLGDGLQHLISILFPVFVDRRPTIQAVEEPELFLHPGFQTKLLDCYLRPELSHVQLLVTTHSNHLLNLTLAEENVSIFRVTKDLKPDLEDQEPIFAVKFINDNARDVLGDLGVQRSSLLLCNCVIFVEGPSDRHYFQRFIDLYCQKNGIRRPTVDLHYSFLEYGGANLASYSFLCNEGKVDPQRLIGSEFLVVIDTDTSESKKLRALQLKESLGEKLVQFKAVEVENLLGPKVISRIVTEYEKSSTPVLSELTWEDYKDRRLGSFIEKELGPNIKRKTKTKRPYADGDGDDVTIKEKTGFCKKALSYLVNHQEMSEEALDIAGILFKFIEAHNPLVKFRNNRNDPMDER